MLIQVAVLQKIRRKPMFQPKIMNISTSRSKIQSQTAIKWVNHLATLCFAALYNHERSKIIQMAGLLFLIFLFLDSSPIFNEKPFFPKPSLSSAYTLIFLGYQLLNSLLSLSFWQILSKLMPNYIQLSIACSNFVGSFWLLMLANKSLLLAPAKLFLFKILNKDFEAPFYFLSLILFKSCSSWFSTILFILRVMASYLFLCSMNMLWRMVGVFSLTSQASLTSISIFFYFN